LGRVLLSGSSVYGVPRGFFGKGARMSLLCGETSSGEVPDFGGDDTVNFSLGNIAVERLSKPSSRRKMKNMVLPKKAQKSKLFQKDLDLLNSALLKNTGTEKGRKKGI